MDDISTDHVATAPSRDLSGHGTALLIIDMINCFDFAGAEELAESARRAADAILTLRNVADTTGWPVIYVNDNFGEWHSEKSKLVERAIASGSPIAQRLLPRDEDYFIIKPQFSGFYATNLPVLLPKLGVRHLILTGVSADMCVLFTAADAHMRDYDLWVPEDAVAATSQERSRAALEIMKRGMGAKTRPTSALSLDRWITGSPAS